MERLVDAYELKIGPLFHRFRRLFLKAFLKRSCRLPWMPSLSQAETQVVVCWRGLHMGLHSLPQQHHASIWVAVQHLNPAQIEEGNGVMRAHLQFCFVGASCVVKA